MTSIIVPLCEDAIGYYTALSMYKQNDLRLPRY